MTNVRLISGSLLALLLAAPGCKSTPEVPSDAGKADVMAAASKVDYMVSIKEAMDPSVDPCDDFYQYACGGWLASTEIPSDKVKWGRSFDEIWENNRNALRVLIEDEAKAGAASDPKLKQISDYYTACSDEAGVESLGMGPLKPWLERIDSIDSIPTLMSTLAALQLVDVDAFFGLYVSPDYKNPDIYVLSMSQAGLGLPDRDYYLSNDERLAGHKKAYIVHVTDMMKHLGIPADEATARAEAVVAFETQLAERSVPRTDLRDPQKRYNPTAKGDFEKNFPPSSLDAYLKAIGAEGVETIVVATPSFFEGYDSLLKSTDMGVLKDYLRWALVDATAGLLPKQVDQAHFEFFGKTLMGQKEQQPRWKRCVTKTGFDLGDTVGEYFVKREFAGDSKEVALEMIHSIEGAFAEGLPELAWMDEVTQARALEKAQAVKNKIGYPDKWMDLSGLTISGDAYFANVLDVRQFESDRWLGRIGQPVDKDEWFMPTFMVNAYYNPSVNDMVFPAGILQAPFFDASHPMSMNLGAIGMVMGHELTHGFDDSGRKFDGSGRLVEWWEPEVSARFEEAAQCVSDKYSSYEVHEGLNVNGELTLGENIADLGGMKQAFRAHRNWIESHGAPEGLGDMSADQLYFLSFAQSWCSMARPEYMDVIVRTDSHSPAQFRVEGALSNFPAFGEAYKCEMGSTMRPEKICQVW